METFYIMIMDNENIKIEGFKAENLEMAEKRFKAEKIKNTCSVVLYDSETLTDFQNEVSMERESIEYNIVE